MLVLPALFVSCNTSKSPLFGKRSAYEKYADKINDAGLSNTQMGREWLRAGEVSLAKPQSINVPFRETGFFAAETPSAAGYIFNAKRGEKIVVNVSTVPVNGILFFGEIWQPGNTDTSLLTVMDTLNNQIEYTVKKDGPFILRLQPELLINVEYTVTITTGPSLAFPVDRSGKPRIISTWGANRDAGARNHEGVDIRAEFRTPALAATDGIITRVNLNNLGGKVVFLNAEKAPYSLYYAHLDSQMVSQGQRVRAGDVIGLIGTTGNARGTVPHLHFGIYTTGGAIDPLAFIDTPRIKPAPILASTGLLHQWLRTDAIADMYEGPSTKSIRVQKVEKETAAFVLAASDNYYKIKLPDGATGYIRSESLTDKILRQQKADKETKLLASPEINAPAKSTIAKDNSLKVIGSYNNFYLVSEDNIQGWIAK